MKLKYRVLHSKPIVDAFMDWCYEQRQRIDLVKSNPLSKALAYTMNRIDTLRVFLSDPDVPIDTNHLERALRVIPMGRKKLAFLLDRIWSRASRDHSKLVGQL